MKNWMYKLSISLLLIPLFCISTAFAQENSYGLEISTLDTPMPVKTRDKQLLVYELHIINKNNINKRINRIEIRDNHNKILNSYAGSKLINNSRVYENEGAVTIQENDVIELKPGMGMFVFVFITMDKKTQAPMKLFHKIWSVEANADKSLAFVREIKWDLPVKHELPPILGAPLEGKNWVAVAGISKDSYHRRTILPFEGQFYLAQRFAIDWEQIGDDGRESSGNMRKNENWHAFGQKVLAVADGKVVKMRDVILKNNIPPGLPSPPPSLIDIPGNFVILQINQNNKEYYAFYAHLQPKSIRVKVGDTVKKGDMIGLLGNTGNSGAPHLHFHISDRPEPLKANGLPFVFEKLKVQGYVKEIDPLFGIFIPKFYKKIQDNKKVIAQNGDLISFGK